MIDVHILTTPGREAWLKECFASLAHQPIKLFVLPGIKNHVGQGRIKGFQQGSAEWVSFVDDDDLVKPGSFASVMESINQFPQADAVFTREELIDEHGILLQPAKSIPKRFSTRHIYRFFRWDHHLMVFRRSKLEPLLPRLVDFPMGCNSYISNFFLKNYCCVMDPFVGYQWRMHKDNWCKHAVSEIGKDHGLLLG